MPHGDTCVSHLFEPGAIPASAGMPPILPTTAEPPSGQATIAAAIIEAATATDATTGLSIVAMIEAATAASTVDVSLVYNVAIVEGVIASGVSAVAGPSITGTVTETAAAADTLDSSIIAAVPVQSMVASTSPVFASVPVGVDAMLAPGVFVSG